MVEMFDEGTTYRVTDPETFLAASPEKRLKLVLDQIDAEPKAWKQWTWVNVTQCGTSGCIAGWTAILAGDVLGYVLRDEDFKVCRVGTMANRVLTSDGEVMDVSDRAKELLGLTESERCDLFAGSNTRQRVDKIVEEIEMRRCGSES